VITAPWAEVIGDPVAQSKSPLIHRRWLAMLGMDGDYLKTRVAPDALASFLAARRQAPGWRGCSVTIPHKLAVIPLLDAIDPAAAATGAVNCIWRDEDRLIGTNSDVDGVLAALAGWHGGRAVLIGAGGAARAALAALRRLGAARVALIARDEAAGAALLGRFGLAGSVHPFAGAREAIAGADLVINASPLGMAGGAPMPPLVLDALGEAVDNALVFDMVYAPVETTLLRRAGSMSLGAVTGLTMLVGQARAAFRLLFGAAAPADDDAALMLELGR